jgi:transcriptional regulator with XRE-family HTH domain
MIAMIDRSAPRRTNSTSPIAAARVAAGLTQADLSQRLGIGTATLQRWESGQTSPSAAKLKSLAEALGVPAAQLI